MLWLDVCSGIGRRRLGSILHSFLVPVSPGRCNLQPCGNRLAELRRATRRTGRDVNTVIPLVEEARRSEMKKVAAFVSIVSGVPLAGGFLGGAMTNIGQLRHGDTEPQRVRLFFGGATNDLEVSEPQFAPPKNKDKVCGRRYL